MVRETLWGDVTPTFTALGVGGAGLLNVTGAGLLALRPWTVVRTRGVMYLKSDQAAAAEQQSVACGYAIVSDQAVAIGLTAVPTPVVDMGSDLWFVYERLMANATDLTDLAIGGQFKEFDSRAMRKVEDGTQLIVVAEGDVGALTAGMEFRHASRILIKLH